jgi:hypothetical protein
MKLERLENYKVELSGAIDQDQTILSYADHFVLVNFNSQILSMFNIDLKELSEFLLAFISSKPLNNELRRRQFSINRVQVAGGQETTIEDDIPLRLSHV